jgi:hypothetical protein
MDSTQAMICALRSPDANARSLDLFCEAELKPGAGRGFYRL